MGKLAERLSDPARSGVYRVEVTEAVEEAAGLNRYPLVRVALDGNATAVLAAAEKPGSRVVLVSDFEQLFASRPAEGQSLVAALSGTALARRERGECFFVAFLDPRRTLPEMARLYNWDKQRQPGREPRLLTEPDPEPR